MSLKDKLLKSQEVTRRTFLKGASAAGAAAALYGCGGGGGGKTYMEEDDTLEVPEIKGTIIPSTTPHNCGGRCVSKFYVEDGVIKRIVSDERGDVDLKDGDDPEYRACVRCHAKKQWFNRNDRLLYPLKQTGERGDINGFQRISWEQAFTEIAAKMQEIKDTYGNEAFHNMYASGDASGWGGAANLRLLNLFGGYTSYYLSYSSPTLQHVARFVEGKGFANPYGNSRQDAQYADNIVLWSCNYHESVIGTNSGWYLSQFKEMGIPITSVDVRYSMSTATVASDFVDVEPGTDSALVLGMMYHLLTDRLADLDIDFIKAYVFGFFDNGNDSYHVDLDTTRYKVPDGASLSAFIMGDDNSLTTVMHGGESLNNATSVYPQTIGYEVNDDDELYGKTVSIWGQKAKTPEWAEKITGVPAAKIRQMADMYLDTKVTTWSGLGYNRGAESEQIIWLLRILSAITKNFGVHGAGYGRNSQNVSPTLPSNGMSSGVSNGVSLKSKIYDDTRLTSPLDYVPTGQMNNLSVFTIPDAVASEATGKSRWNDGQVKQLTTPFKALFIAAGNIMYNQHSGTEYAGEIFKDKSKLELIVNMEPFMTSSASISDYILPSTLPGEKPGAVNAWTTGEVAIKMNKVIDSPGEVMDEYTICGKIAEKLGFGADYFDGYAEGTEGMEARLRDGWESANLSSKYGMTYDEWSEKGIASLHGTYDEQFVNHQAFREDPVNNPLQTPSGKFEAYCLGMMEDYEARYHENVDTVTADSDGTDTLYGGTLYTKYHADSNARRFVYPIPMYIPMSEGRHAIDAIDPSDELCHDDPLGLNDKGYTFNLLSWHLMYRSHSTLNNNGFLNEVYKKDINGNKAFIDNEREFTDGVWDEDIYEPIWINAADAKDAGVTTGDRVLVSNDRGKLYATAVVTQRTPVGTVSMGQGGWLQLNSEGIDIGGCVSTVTSPRPSRICKGNNCATDCRVKFEKA
ncbi:molybdopterin-dependent oxidoreductase [Deferribacteres bacterium DY0037]